MTDQPRQPDDLEALIAQVHDLEEAGVFKRTPVDPASMVRCDASAKPQRLTHRLFVGLQVAAGLALVVGLGAVWRAGLGTSGGGGSSANEGFLAMSALTEQVSGVARCLRGPSGGLISADCESVDFDDDGDVDLADYGALQLAFSEGN